MYIRSHDMEASFPTNKTMMPLHLLRLALYFALSLAPFVFAERDGHPHRAKIRPLSLHADARPDDDPVPIVTSRNGTHLPPYSTVYEFDQLIDHNDPNMGTFKQRFWHTYEYYEKDGPVVIMTPGEINADGYDRFLTNTTMTGLIAQRQNGSTVVIEHRFFGNSNPRPDLSEESLKLLTIQQAIDDLTYFAYNVVLPMPGGDQMTPDKAPWILVGGSYSGALTAWTMVNKPGIFYAGYASSGVVEAIFDYWRYFEPIREHMPKNCSADVEAAMSLLDQVFMSDNQTAIDELKESFGLGELTHLDDVAAAVQLVIDDWQLLQVYSGPGSSFYNFCDALEVKDGATAPTSGWGAAHALGAWGAYFKETYLDIVCPKSNIQNCFDTYNSSSPVFTNITVDNNQRSWSWMVCNEVGYLQDAAPMGHPSLISRLIQPEYFLHQCQQYFPETFPKEPTTINVDRTNDLYQGWNVKVDRLIFVNGKRDPWLDATVSAEGQNIQSTPMQPILLGDGFHTSDLSVKSNIDPTIEAIQNQVLGYMDLWLSTWKPGTASSNTDSERHPSVAVGVSASSTSEMHLGMTLGRVGSKG